MLFLTLKQEDHDMIMWDKVIMKKEDAVFDGLIDDQYTLYNDDKSIL